MIEIIHNDAYLEKGIVLLKNNKYINDSLELKITALQENRKGYHVNRNGERLVINYSTIASFYRALSIALSYTKTEYDLDFIPTAKDLGVMVDCSRNAVISVDTAKCLVEQIVLLGYSYLELYTEDTIEVNKEPYFGQFRGRFTKAEIKEIEAYADNFGVEIVPCIQTLAHLNAIFKWHKYQEIRDLSDILLAEDKRTYELLDNIFSSIRSAYKSKRINIGMDEAYLLGLGKYRTLHGNKSRFEILNTHLKHVLSLCDKYNFKPEIWCDMFFRLAFNGEYRIEKRNVPDEVKKIVPPNVRLIYWEYLHSDEKNYLDMLEMNKELTKNVGFATGAWKWQGFAPNNALSESAGRPAFNACRKTGVDDILVTTWGDNGAECSLFSVAATFTLFGLINDMGIEDKQLLEDLAKFVYGYTYEELRTLDLPDLLYKGPVFMANPAKYIFYNDLLTGLFDRQIHQDFDSIYRNVEQKLSTIAKKDGKLKKQFMTLASLSKINAIKCYLATHLKSAYDKHDIVTLRNLANNQITVLYLELDNFYHLFKEQWNAENKVFGFEVMDNRLGGLMRRTLTAKETILNYVDQKVTVIPELEVSRLHFDCKDVHEDNEKDNLFVNNWIEIISASIV